MKTKRIICLYGGPSCGKSTVCAGLFYKLKILGYECEMNREYIKDFIYDKRPFSSGDQSYFFAKMARKERIYMNYNLDFIITDSPLILTHYYGLKTDELEQITNTSLIGLSHHHTFCKMKGYKVDHFYINRAKKYSNNGRLHNEEEARQCDIEIKEMLNNMGIKYQEVLGDINCVDTIINSLANNKE